MSLEYRKREIRNPFQFLNEFILKWKKLIWETDKYILPKLGKITDLSKAFTQKMRVLKAKKSK